MLEMDLPGRRKNGKPEKIFMDIVQEKMHLTLLLSYAADISTIVWNLYKHFARKKSTEKNVLQYLAGAMFGSVWRTRKDVPQCLAHKKICDKHQGMREQGVSNCLRSFTRPTLTAAHMASPPKAYLTREHQGNSGNARCHRRRCIFDSASRRLIALYPVRVKYATWLFNEALEERKELNLNGERSSRQYEWFSEASNSDFNIT